MQFSSVYCAFSLYFFFVRTIFIEPHLDYLDKLIVLPLCLKLFLIEPILIGIFFIGFSMCVIPLEFDLFFQFTDAPVLSDLAINFDALVF